MSRSRTTPGRNPPRRPTVLPPPPQRRTAPARGAEGRHRHGLRAALKLSTRSAMDIPWTEEKQRRDAINSGDYGRHYTPYVQPRRGALVGDEIYFTLRWGNVIVKYNLSENCLSLINPPSPDAYYITLMLMEDSSLGFACIDGSSLYLWSRKVNSEGAAEWVQCKVVELETMIPIADPDDEAIVVGSAEGVDVIFVSTGVGLFTIKINSGQVKKVDKPEVYFSMLPYMSFYTPDCHTLSSLAASKAEDSVISDVPLN